VHTAGGGTSDAAMTVGVNKVQQPGTISCTRLQSANQSQNLGQLVLLPFNTGDNVEIYWAGSASQNHLDATFSNFGPNIPTGPPTGTNSFISVSLAISQV
jgi:hypothetical protein